MNKATKLIATLGLFAGVFGLVESGQAQWGNTSQACRDSALCEIYTWSFEAPGSVLLHVGQTTNRAEQIQVSASLGLVGSVLTARNTKVSVPRGKSYGGQITLFCGDLDGDTQESESSQDLVLRCPTGIRTGSSIHEIWEE